MSYNKYEKDYIMHNKKYNRVINEINDYINMCNINSNNDRTPNLLLNEVLNGCVDEYMKIDYDLNIINIDPFNVLKYIYGEFYEEQYNLNALD